MTKSRVRAEETAGGAMVNVHEAKTHLSRLLNRVGEGEEVVIARGGKPIAVLVPFAGGSPVRAPGSAKGKVVIGDDFDSPLPDDLLKAFLT